MSLPVTRAAIILLASGLSRRYGRRDKLFANLGGRPLISHAATAVRSLPALTHVAVCPADRRDLRDKLTERHHFVLALNREPKRGLGHSIALGAQVALQFRPDALVFCMADMPFIEPWLIEALVARLSDADIAHAGSADRPHPPTAFGPACFDQLRTFDGDDGAKQIIGQGGFRVAAVNAPEPLLIDVDTRDALSYTERQLTLRNRIESSLAQDRRPVDNPAGAPVDILAHNRLSFPVDETVLPPIISAGARSRARSS